MGSRVLIIEDDEWEAQLLAKSLADAGYEVDIADAAQSGFEMACSTAPDCIVCDMMLPDLDGSWVARRVRTEAGKIANTPFLFIAEADDKESRLQGFKVGADVYMAKPFRHEEVVAQVSALIDMKTRLEGQRDSLPMSSPMPPAFRGDLAEMSLATLLTIFDMDRRTGRLKVKSTAGLVAAFEIHDGAIVRTSIEDIVHDPVQAIGEVLGWGGGSFWFRPEAVAPAMGPRIGTGSLLLEAMRLQDEAAR